MALTLDQLNATTLPHYEKVCRNIIYDNVALLDRIRKGNRVVKIANGLEYRLPIRYSRLDDASSVDPDTARLTIHKETRTALQFDMRFNKVDTVKDCCV